MFSDSSPYQVAVLSTKIHNQYSVVFHLRFRRNCVDGGSPSNLILLSLPLIEIELFLSHGAVEALCSSLDSSIFYALNPKLNLYKLKCVIIENLYKE